MKITFKNKTMIMKKYCMYNWEETKELYIGEFESDEKFWEYYLQNKIEIIKKQNQLDAKSHWTMTSF